MRRGLTRFLKYTGVGVSTFGFDLALLFLLTDLLAWHYALAAAVSFAVAVSVNYLVSRRWVFPGSAREGRHAYAIFLAVAVTGALGVAVGMWLLVGVLGWGFLAARVAVAALTGFWNYLMNLYVNFRVAGK